MRSREILSVAAALLIVSATAAQAQSVLVEIDDLSPHELKSQAFALTGTTRLQVEAVGADDRMRGRSRGNSWNFDADYWRGNAWILDADNRTVVWELEDSDTDRRRGGIEEFSGTIELPAGRYIAYFASYSGFPFSGSWFGRSRSDYDDDGLSEEFLLRINGAGDAIDMDEARDAANAELAFVSFRDMEDDEDERIGFSVGRETRVEVYSIGEVTRESTYDYGWLINADTREILWRLDRRSSDPAGGAEKNRVSRDTLTLAPGNYAAIYVTDGSHDAYDWNSSPPWDPEYYGMTVSVLDRGDLNRIRTFDYENLPRENVIAEITRVRDDESESVGFTLSRDADVRIYALGEGGSDGMYDYGWIYNATTHETVWEMRYRNTDHAGGGRKNRLADTVLRLDAGSYVVNYVSDGSHSFGDWNDGAPIDAESWGITVLGIGDFDPGIVSEYDEDDDPNVIARLVRIRDNDYRRQRFTLDEDTSVRVYAIGEGQSGTMYDYAWIENSRGRTVWEMTYRSTDRAGGARKNRMFNDVVELPAGDYTVYYESDGSHSFNDWNSAPPRDPANYGVTIYRLP